MQTIAVNEWVPDPTPNRTDDRIDEQAGGVQAAFEACVTFSTVGDGSSVCGACGWLDADHGPASGPSAVPAVALVRSLSRPVRARSVRTPKRLAS